MLYRLEMPPLDGDEAVRAFIEGWIDHPALKHIVEAEGGDWPSGPLETRVDALHDFSSRWDFRGGAERLDIGSASTNLDRDDLMSAAGDLGMTDAALPTLASYDHGLVLGGTALASIYRLKRLYELRENGIGVRRIAILTALREVASAEVELVLARPEIAGVVASKPRTEFEVMTAAAEFFSATAAEMTIEQNDNPHLSSARAQAGDALVMAAPSADPTRRANSRDNYDVYASRIGADDSVLVVTSSIYLPYQFLVALQALGWEEPRTIEAVGFPPDWMDGILTGPGNILQELRSALFAAQATLRQLSV